MIRPALYCDANAMRTKQALRLFGEVRAAVRTGIGDRRLWVKHPNVIRFSFDKFRHVCGRRTAAIHAELDWWERGKWSDGRAFRTAGASDYVPRELLFFFGRADGNFDLGLLFVARFDSDISRSGYCSQLADGANPFAGLCSQNYGRCSNNEAQRQRRQNSGTSDGGVHCMF